jgi:hypothetical protein
MSKLDSHQQTRLDEAKQALAGERVPRLTPLD